MGHINEFNYIRFTDTYYNITRYCFVTSIAIQNGIAIINYLEDVWHNYVYGLSIDRCIISQKNDVRGIPARHIIDYEGNSAPAFYIVDPTGNSFGDQLMVVKFQLYKTAQSGEITARYPVTGVVYYKDVDNENQTVVYTDRNNIADFLYKSAQKIDAVTLIKPLYPGVEAGDYNIDITDIYIIQRSYLTGMYDFSTGVNIEFNDSIVLQGQGNITTKLYIVLFNNNQGLTPTISYKPFEGKIPSFGYKTIAIGNYSMAIPFSYNGIDDTEVKVYFQTDIKSFALFYGINNQLVEITECYNYNYPINIETAENLQLQQLNRKLANDTYERSKVNIVTDTLKGVAAFTGGLASISMGNIGGGFQSVVSGAVEPVDTFIELKNAQQRLDSITNAGLYTSNSGVSATSNAVLNANVALILYQIDPTNESIVNNISEEFGNVCNTYLPSLIVNGEIVISNIVFYEYFIISKCDITGGAPNNILLQIKNILKRGVRVWRFPDL